MDGQKRQRDGQSQSQCTPSSAFGRKTKASAADDPARGALQSNGPMLYSWYAHSATMFCPLKPDEMPFQKMQKHIRLVL